MEILSAPLGAVTAIKPAKGQSKPHFTGQSKETPSLYAPSPKAVFPHLISFQGASTPALSWQELPSVTDAALGQIRRFQFSNGMGLYAIVRKDVPLVSYGELIHTGSVNETEDNNGISHFFEHLIFKGTPLLKPGESDHKLEALGAGVNAWTNYDATFYYLYNVPSQNLAEAIKIKAEMLQNALVPPDDLLKERFTVVEEIKMYANRKTGKLFEDLVATVYGDHPYRRTILGPARNIGDAMRYVLDDTQPKEQLERNKRILTEMAQGNTGQGLTGEDKKAYVFLKGLLSRRKLTADKILALYPFNPTGQKLSETELRGELKVRDLSREDILAYYARFYAPSNRDILVVGDFDIDQVLSQVAREYNRPFPVQSDGRIYESSKGSRPTSRHIKKTVNPRGIQTNAKTVYDSQVSQATMMLGFNGPLPLQVTPKERAALDIANTVLLDGDSSRLHQRLVETDKLAQAVGGGFWELAQRSLSYLSVTADPDKLDAVKTAIQTELESLIQTGITPEELSKAVRQLKTQMANSAEEQFSAIGALADLIRRRNNGPEMGERLSALEAVTLADVRAAASKYLQPSGAHVLTLAPKPVTNKTASSKPGLPKPSLQFSGRLTPMDQSITLDRGSELIVRSKPGNLKTALSLRVKGGAAFDLEKGLAGATAWLNEMLQRATQTMSTQQLQEALASKGITLEVTPEVDSLVITLEGLSEAKADMFLLLAEILKGPKVDATELAEVKTRQAKKYASAIETRTAYASQAQFTEALYPETHPSGQNYGRILAKKDAVSAEALRAYFQEAFTPKNITVSAVGDITVEEAQTQFNQALAPLSYTGTEIKHQFSPIQFTLPASKIVTKSREKMTQAEIRRGWVAAPHIKEADRPALTLLNGLLRAGMSSRLFQTFREGEKGLCYSVTSTYTPSTLDGRFEFYIGTDPVNINKVLGLFQREVDKLTTTLATEAELSRVRNLLNASILAQTQGVKNVASSLSKHRGLDVDSPEELAEKLATVTPEQIQAVARKVLSQPSITTVLAPKEALRSQNLPVDGEKTLS